MNEIIEFITKYNILPLLIALFGGAIILAIALTYHPGKKIAQEYERIRGELQEKKRIGFFDYDQINKRLISNGFAFNHPAISDPIIYTAIKVVIGAVAAAACVRIHFGASIIAFIIGYFLLDVYASISNAKDNEKITADLQTIYDALAVQIRGGVYIINALYEDYALVSDKNPRLKAALMQLSGEMLLTSDAKQVINNFQSKFSNKYIDSLCVAIIQSLDSGEAVDLLGDISEQLKSFQKNALQRKKQELERSLTLCSIIEFTAMIIFMVLMCVRTLFNSVSFM